MDDLMSAEELLERGRWLLLPKLVCCEDSQTDDEDFRRGTLLARCKTAIDFARAVDRKPSLAVRAVIEDWTIQHVVRELY